MFIQSIIATLTGEKVLSVVDPVWFGFTQTLHELWTYEIVNVDGDSVGVNKVVWAVILAFLGYFIARHVSTRLGRRLPRFGIGPGPSAALESLAFYFLFLLIFLFALNLVHIPLTVFTVLGGAIAIGVGFGSQNVMNNFISGVILLIEQPVRVGDLIDVEGLTGRVLHIGGRSTRLRTGDNIDIIVPNSTFLEKHVVNWTLGDDSLRLRVRVGVAYGSAVEQVRDVLLKVAAADDRVLKHPEPFVWFSDFGDSALIFDAHFWVQVHTLSDRYRIESDFRFRVDAAFREADIEIAFPQRDVHLKLGQPVDVRLRSNS